MAIIRVKARIDVYGLAAGDTANVEDSGDAAYFLAVGWLERVDFNQVPLEELMAASTETPPQFQPEAVRLDFAGLDAATRELHDQAIRATA